MDWLIEAEPQISRTVYDNVADLLNLHVDRLLFDTTSTYFELDEPDEPVWRDGRGHRVADAEDEDAVKEDGFRTYGKSKDSRGDLPQVVVGMAVTRDGIPVRCWCWPGNTADSALIRQVKDDMRDWSLARVEWVADRGFTSAENRRYLQHAGGHYILGEKLRGDSERPRPPWPGKAAISRSPTTSRSRRSTSMSPATGSSSATTPRRPRATRRSGNGWSPNSAS
jgi:hypothetical protein